MPNHTLNDEEIEFLAKLLERRHAELLHELHHTATNQYREVLKEEIELTERLQARLGAPVELAGTSPHR